MIIQTVYSLRFISGPNHAWLRFNSLAEVKAFLQNNFETVHGDMWGISLYIMKEVYTLSMTNHQITKTETPITSW